MEKKQNPLQRRVERVEIDFMETKILEVLRYASKRGMGLMVLMKYVDGRSQLELFASVLNNLQGQKIVLRRGDIYNPTYYLTHEFN